MQANNRITRQSWGCGYEPPAPPHVQVMPWQPPQNKLGYRHPRPTVCVAYLTSLPEVLEIDSALSHWQHGALQLFCGSDAPTEGLLDALVILESEIERVKSWAITPIADGGGRT